jgi:hypothetical protein
MLTSPVIAEGQFPLACAAVVAAVMSHPEEAEEEFLHRDEVEGKGSTKIGEGSNGSTRVQTGGERCDQRHYHSAREVVPPGPHTWKQAAEHTDSELGDPAC